MVTHYLEDDIAVVATSPTASPTNGEIQDYYPLSPIQEGMLFHHLSGEHPGVDIEQMVIDLPEAIDPGALEAAWQAVVDRHDVIRTSFEWEELDQPRQRVHGLMPIAIEHRSWRGLSTQAQEAKTRAYLLEDRRRGFDLRQPPLQRWVLIELGDERFRLIWTFHHILLDGRSFSIILREVFAIYENPAIELPASQPYRTYIDWLQAKRDPEAREFWRNQLKGFVAPTPMYDDVTVTSFDSGDRYGESELQLPSTTSDRLRNLAREQSVTLNTVIMAAWGLLLARYSGEEDVVFAATKTARHSGFSGADTMVGLFLNTIPVRMKLTPETPVSEVLRNLRQEWISLREFEHTPLVVIKEASEVPPAQPLCDSLVVFENQRFSTELASLGGAWSKRTFRLLEETNYALTLAAYGDTELLLKLEYDNRRFGRPAIERMLGHLQTLLEGMASDPTQRVSAVSLVMETERQQLAAWNDTTRSFLHDQCIHRVFEQHAERTPNKAVLICESEQLTYAELNARANQLTRELLQHGVGPNQLVGLCLERSLDMVVALLAISKSGAAYMPLDPYLPTERIAYMIADSGLQLLITDRETGSSIRDFHGIVINVEEENWRNNDTSNVGVSVGPEDLAYVIYTSGSTGWPKGVEVPRRALTNLLCSMRDWFDFTERDCLLAVTTISFDIAGVDVWLPWLVGAHIVLASREAAADGQQLRLLMQRHGVTFLQATPVTWRLLLDAGWQGGNIQVVCTGEAMPQDLAASLAPIVPRLWNMYGPTETTIWSTGYRVQGPSAPVLIGRPIANTRCYVLDEYRQPVPIGAIGELYIAGDGLARGYRNRAELTAEKFVADPFHSGQRMYRTGDLARYYPDGNIQCLGRTDHQVKIRGFRIELGEIETVLRECPGVKECAVVAREDCPGDKRLVAYVVSGEGENPTARDLSQRLKQRLPEYMVPSAFVTLSKLPLTSNGKLDRRVLPAPELDSLGLQSEYVAPRNLTEETMAGIWAELLRVPRVGIYDNFFELGGHSLLAVRMIEQMRRQGLHVDLRSLFRTPTVADLATVASLHTSVFEVPPNKIPAGSSVITPEMLPLVKLSTAEISRILSDVPGGATNVQDIYPLAPLQEGIFFHHLMATDGDPYLLSTVYGADTRERLDDYLKALQAVIDRHDILRTSIIWEGLSEPMQVVWQKALLPVEEIEFDAESGDVLDQLKEHFDPRHHKIDMSQAPLMRAAITQDLAHSRWLLLILSHHLAIDHTSLELMREEIHSHLLGQSAVLTKPIPFRNFVAHARFGIDGAELERFFRGMLGDVDEPTAPLGLEAVQGDGAGIAESRLEVDPTLVRRLRERARKLGVSMASVCHLAWARVLSQVTGRDDVVFGTVLFGRTQAGEGADRALGLFMNTLPVRIKLGASDAESGVRATHAQLAELLRFQHAALAVAQRCSAIPSPAPLFSALLNYRHTKPGTELPGISEVFFEERTNYPLRLNIDDTGEGILLSTQTEATVGPARMCEFMHNALAGLDQALEVTPSGRVINVDVLPASERRRLLVEWNDTATDYPRDKCTHQIIEQQAARTPDRVAVVDGTRRLTYAELNTRANQLGHWLQRQGIGPEVLAGVQVERSVDLLVALLGVLKAGGAYVPLDPIYPPERRAFMVEDSGLKVLITDDYLREHEAVLNEQPTTNCNSAVRPEYLAYVIYTSGSTGKPKGVAITHGALLNLLWSMRAVPGITTDDVLLAVTTISFDIAGLELYLPLTVGASIVLATRESALNGFELIQQMDRHGVTMMQATPVTWQMLLDCGWTGKRDLKVLCGGEALRRELAEHLLRCCAELWNVYGPTETTIWSLVEHITNASDPILIGRPIANTEVFILDRAGQPVPVGVSGELLIGGAGVARGYHNRPELSAEKFIPHPFSSRPGARLYRTGDLARYYPDGRIECLGRIDFQVKIRGFRIELGEIESILAQRHEVARNVVVVREDVPGDKRIVAYVILAEGATFDSGAAHQHLREVLPDYMVPSDFVVMDAFPLTPNKKIDRRALPAPIRDCAEREAGYVAPGTPVEETLCQIWAELLGVPRVGIHDNFFELGGHSLLAVRVLARILEKWPHHKLTIAIFLQAPTVAEFAALIQSGKLVATDCVVPFRKSGSRPPLFCLPGAGGNVVSLRHMAAALSADQPFYCLQAKGLDGSAPLTSVEEAATFYLKEVRKVQPCGPLYVAGACFGGLIAFEMAQSLRRKGEQVGLLALIDTSNSAYGRTQSVPRRLADGLRFFARQVRVHVRKVQRVPWSERVEYVSSRIKGIRFQVASLLSIAKGEAPAPSTEAVLPVIHGEHAGFLRAALDRVALASADAARTYVPAYYPGDILLFKATERAPEPFNDEALGWNSLCGHVEVIRIDGRHEDVGSEPQIRVVTRRIEAAIERHIRHVTAAADSTHSS